MTWRSKWTRRFRGRMCVRDQLQVGDEQQKGTAGMLELATDLRSEMSLIRQSLKELSQEVAHAGCLGGG